MSFFLCCFSYSCLNGYDLSKKMGDYRQLGVFENLLANICFVKGDYTGAIDLCNKSIERDKNINNETDSSVNELLIGQCVSFPFL